MTGSLIAGRHRLWKVAIAACLAVHPVAAQQAPSTMLVHLPSAPVESAGRQAEAVTALAERLLTVLPDLPLETKIFRRLADAREFLETDGESVALALSDAALVDDLPMDLEPSHRFVREGRSTYHRLVVVRSDRQEIRRLVDLRGASLAVVETVGTRAGEFLSQRIFSGALDPDEWFRAIEPAADDFAATASVLYEQSDAALVAEYNPLLRQNLGGDLRVVYTSPPLSLPTFSVRGSAFNVSQRAALDNFLEQMSGTSPELAALGVDGLERIDGRRALRAVPRDERKRLSLAAPAPDSAGLVTLPLPDPGDLPFVLAIELPDVTIDPDTLAKPDASN